MKLKHILLFTAFLAGWALALTHQPDFNNSDLSIKQIMALAEDDSENEPPPFPPPGMPRPLPDTIILPDRFYPKYLLAKLYDETGQQPKALKTANELLNKETKIQSMALDEIKAEMRAIMDKLEKSSS